MKKRQGRCLCGNIQYEVGGKPSFPHLCSCRMCQLWSGAPSVAWVEFPMDQIEWTGPGGEPALYRSSEKTQRGFCRKCGSTIAAIDEGYDKISLTMASLEDPSAIVPGKQHSYAKEAPSWWSVTVKR